ncbi:HAD-IIA family hydrolase [Lacrimispora saccharolytica]|nr:HAD-IIA family hydrolase [Lacrimispora saccharolytica]QRV20310.1 HAD-IIA family hydrolase [Lacrimispora saccharolytica]
MKLEKIMGNREILDQTKLFVLDMDGTFYLGDQILSGALDFLREVEKSGRKYVFFTNNSSKSPESYRRKLEKMNCYVSKDQIMTSGDVTIRYINTFYKGKRVYLVGTKTLEESFASADISLTQDMPDLVVIGFDTSLTYEKLEKACTFIRNGALFLATHLDINCPTESGFIPDCGSFCAAISCSTGVTPKYLGKPFQETIDMVEEKTGFARQEMAFVGDRIYTDVAAGVKNGAAGILVLTGETKEEDLAASEISPDAVFKSIKEMGDTLKHLHNRD